jgi:pyruvate ferredoxin oxidoreductase gamma subunit
MDVGGQGVVTAAELLSVAAFLEDKHAQAFPSFGSERMGAPVVSFCRIDTKEIRLREPIVAPDALIVQDVTLFKAIDVFLGLKDSGYLLVNTNQSFDDLQLDPVVAKLPAGHVVTVPATELALKHIGRPVPNAAARSICGVDRNGPPRVGRGAIHEAFPGAMGNANVAAATEAHDAVVARVRTAA